MNNNYLLCFSCQSLPYNIDSFPNKLWFLRVYRINLLKTLWGKEKLLDMSNFSFSNSVSRWRMPVLGPGGMSTAYMKEDSNHVKTCDPSPSVMEPTNRITRRCIPTTNTHTRTLKETGASP